MPTFTSPGPARGGAPGGGDRGPGDRPGGAACPRGPPTEECLPGASAEARGGRVLPQRPRRVSGQLSGRVSRGRGPGEDGLDMKMALRTIVRRACALGGLCRSAEGPAAAPLPARGGRGRAWPQRRGAGESSWALAGLSPWGSSAGCTEANSPGDERGTWLPYSEEGARASPASGTRLWKRVKRKACPNIRISKP